MSICRSMIASTSGGESQKEIGGVCRNSYGGLSVRGDWVHVIAKCHKSWITSMQRGYVHP